MVLTYDSTDGRLKFRVNGRYLVYSNAVLLEWMNPAQTFVQPLPTPLSWRSENSLPPADPSLGYAFVIQGDGWLLYSPTSIFYATLENSGSTAFTYELLGQDNTIFPVFVADGKVVSAVIEDHNPNERGMGGSPPYYRCTFTPGFVTGIPDQVVWCVRSGASFNPTGLTFKQLRAQFGGSLPGSATRGGY